MRYFIELAYNGARYGGFQVQDNSNTIQAEVEKAFFTFYREQVQLTGSSRTDAGVHAIRNYFQLDTGLVFRAGHLYNLNAILPDDIAISRIFPVPDDFHCRFQAIARTYEYFLYQEKNPFLDQRAWFYPYPLDLALLNEAAAVFLEYSDFTSFSKRNTQAKTRVCNLSESYWFDKEGQLVYRVTANRFLRGMVKGLVGTMLQVGRNRIGIPELRRIIEVKDCSKAFFDTPAHGLYLVNVAFPEIPSMIKGIEK